MASTASRKGTSFYAGKKAGIVHDTGKKKEDNSIKNHRIALRLCTQGNEAPQLPLKEEYDILGVETTLFVTPSTLSKASISKYTNPEGSGPTMRDMVSYSLRNSRTMDSEDGTRSETISTMQSTYKDEFLRKVGIMKKAKA